LHFRYIAIEGPIGAGKTTLAERLGTRLDATVVLEEAENPFLADFYADKPGAALQTQLFYLLNRHRQQTSLRQADLFSQTTICDYLFDKDKIFAYLNLDDNELFIYQRLYERLSWIENRVSSLGEQPIRQLRRLQAGMVVFGQNWNDARVLKTQKQNFQWFGWKTPAALSFYWQYTTDADEESPESYLGAVEEFGALESADAARD
jgi:hypothetical protein